MSEATTAPAPLEATYQELDECHALLYRMVTSLRPIAGGHAREAWDLLLRHGVLVLPEGQEHVS